MTFYFLITSATSALVFGSQWYNSHSCRGYPQSMHVFYTADLTDCQQPETETWPSMYKTYCPVYPYDFCGNVNVPLSPKQCCFDSLDVGASEGYSSAVMVEIENEEAILSYALKESNGGTYCSIKPVGAGDALGYHSVYLLNDGSCHDSQLKCSDRALMVYPEAECQGTPVMYPLTDTTNLLTVDLLGDISASIVTFNQGTSSVGWVTGLPPEMLVPANKNGWEILAIVGFAWSIASFAYCLYYAAIKFRKTHTVTTAMMLISYIILLVWICFRIAYVYTIFPTYDSFSMTSKAEKITLQLGTLSVALYTTHFLSTVTNMTRKQTIAMNAMVILVHFVFVGKVYMAPFFRTDPGSFMLAWELIDTYWYIILYFYDLVPVFVVIWKLVEATQAFKVIEKIQAIVKVDKIFLLVVLIQIGNTILHFVCMFYRDSTDVLGSDYVYIAFACFNASIVATHSVLNTLMIERMRWIMKLMSKSIGTTTSSTKATAAVSQHIQLKNTKINE